MTLITRRETLEIAASAAVLAASTSALAAANRSPNEKVSVGNISYRTGRRLVFDAKTETFPNDPEVNKFLSREYRKGYELPKV